MDLYIMRHGIAEERDVAGVKSDRDRQLTPKGAKRVRQEAEGLAALQLSFDRILTSPFPRARDTARIVGETLGIKPGRLVGMPELAPNGSVSKIIRSLHPYSSDGDLLLVGHEPLLSRTVSFLIDGTENITLSLKKGGICRIEVDRLPPKVAVMHWLLTPKQLRLLARP